MAKPPPPPLLAYVLNGWSQREMATALANIIKYDKNLLKKAVDKWSGEKIYQDQKMWEMSLI